MDSPGPSSAPRFFESATGVNIQNSTMIAAGTYMATCARESHSEISQLLALEVAPHAILNAGGRADPVGCYPGTREEVISKIEHWMASGYRGDSRIFWLSGPAGAGKSAIVQTIADHCVQHQALMVNFFFFRGDSSRNSVQPVIATLLHQLIQLFPRLRPIIDDKINGNRLIQEIDPGPISGTDRWTYPYGSSIYATSSQCLALGAGDTLQT